MFETSSDILNLVLSLGIFVIAALVAWLLFYAIMMFRDVRQATKSIKDKVETVDEILKTLKDKIEKSASYFGILVELVSKLVSHFHPANNNTPKRSKRKIVEAEVDDDG